MGTVCRSCHNRPVAAFMTLSTKTKNGERTQWIIKMIPGENYFFEYIFPQS